MTDFFVGDVVKVEMPRGYSNRGVLGVSLLFTTSPEARFDGATGTVTEINPVGPFSAPQYLVDFRTHDNSRAGLPWQAQWFREEWLALVERVPVAAAAGAPVGAGARADAAATAGGGGTPGERLAASSTDGDIDPHAAQVGGFSWGEDSELATQDRPASDPPTGRTTQTPEDGGYFGTPAVKQPERDHSGEARGDGKVGPAATGAPAPTSGSAGASAATAELPPRGDVGSGDTTELTPRGESPELDSGGASGRSTRSISGASTTAPSSPIGETELRTTATGGGEAAANTAERYAAGKDPGPDQDPPEENPSLSRPGTSLLDPSRVSGFDEDLGGSSGAEGGKRVARRRDGARTANQE